MKEKINIVLKKMGDDNVSEFSAQCSYYMILAFVPFLILLLSLIQYTGVNPDTVYNLILKLVPSTVNEQIINIVQEVYSKSFATISISVIFTLISAQRGFYSLLNGLNRIYEIKDVKYIYLKLRSFLNTIIFLFLIFIILVFSIFGEDVVNIWREKLPFLNGLIYQILSNVFLLVFIFSAYLGIYKFLPRHKVSFRSQTVGALIGAIGLLLVSFVFSKYLDIFRGFSVMYGSLTALMLIIMWTYTCIYTLFLGAEINKLISLLKNINNKKIKEEE